MDRSSSTKNHARDVAADGRRLLATKALRSLGDGFASIAIAAYLTERGFGPAQVGLLATVALGGTAAATLLVGFVVDRIGRRRMLIGASLLTVATGIAFASVEPYWLLLLVALLGTINPSSGDVSVFLPVEQAALAGTVPPRRRTWLYARYSLFGFFAAAVGALLSGAAGPLSGWLDWDLATGLRVMLLGYAILGIAMTLIYRSLSPAVELIRRDGRAAPLSADSRRLIMRLSALFFVDSFAGGFVVQSIMAVWLFHRFGLSVETAAGIFFVTGVLGAASMLLAPRIAARIGLVQTMAFTHIPANIALILTPFMPNLGLALVLLFIRHTLAQMDVPARTAFIMSVVPPEERTAAAGVTNVARSVASATSPALGGALLALGPFGLPLVLAGTLKIIYDLALLRGFHRFQLADDDPPPVIVDGDIHA